MFVAKNIQTDHKDLIHDVSYDFHGKRMATTSCDQYIKIFDLINNEWKCTASWKGHSGVIWKVIWAYPEFGNVIATCSYDRTLAVWEEIPNEEVSGHWVKRGNLVDSRCPISDITFAPRHQGLKLATCSVDGNVRIYEAPDIMNLSQWSLQSEIACKATCSCIAWSASRLHPSLLLVGCEDAGISTNNILIFEFVSETRQWAKIECINTVSGPIRHIAFSPNLGRSYDLVAVAGKEITLLQIKYNPDRTLKSDSTSKYEIRNAAQLDDHRSQVWRLSWNITGTILASSGDDGCVRLWKCNYLEGWKCVAELKSGSENMHTKYSRQSSAEVSTSNQERENQTLHRSIKSIDEKPVWH